MLRTLMQVFVKGSAEAAKLYQKAFHAEWKCAYPDRKGGYMHSELDAFGQILAISEAENTPLAGNTMMFCFHFGPGGEKDIETAYEALKEGAKIQHPLGPCDYSPLMFALEDAFGVTWCLFI